MCYLGNKAQKQFLVTPADRLGFVPGAVLALVGLASQLEGAAGVAGSHLHASSHLQRQQLRLLNQDGCWRGHRCHWCHSSASPQPVALSSAPPQPVAVSMTLLSQHRHGGYHVEALIAQIYV